MRRLAPVLPLLLSLAAPTLVAAQGSPPQAACQAAEFHQFDFWIGDWEVRNPDGSKAGRHRIEPILGGCALQENWTGAGGGSGKSLNMYDRRRKVWHQTWVDAQGNMLQLDGGFSGQRMTLTGESPDSSGGTVLNRIIWEQTAPGRVRQLWESSRDGGLCSGAPPIPFDPCPTLPCVSAPSRTGTVSWRRSGAAARPRSTWPKT